MTKILAIDDIRDNLISLKAIIRDIVPESAVYAATNGPQGIELALENDPDVILLDVIMPGMDGFEVCRLLKKNDRTSDIPVVFLTALKGDKDNRIKALEAGAEGFLTKPIDETELIAQIRAMVKIKAANQQKRNETQRLKQLVDERTEALLSELSERKRMEEILRESEKRFRYISSTISDISYSCKKFANGSSSLDWLYGATESMTGYTTDELYKLDCWGKLVIEEDFPIFKKHILNVSPGSSDVCQLRLRKKDNSIIWITATAACQNEQRSQEVEVIYGSLVDITKNMLAQKALQQSEQQLRGIFESLQDAYFQADLSGRFKVVSPSAVKMYGFQAKEELLGQPAEILYYQTSDREMMLSLLRSAGRIEDFVCQAKKKDGSPFWVSMNVQLMKGDNGQIIGTEGVVRDISDRKQAEDALRESEEKYRRMVNHLPDSIIIHQEGKIVFANAITFSLLGAKSADQVLGKSALDFVHPDSRPIAIERIGRMHQTGEPSGFAEEKFITLKNEVTEAEVIGIPVTYMGKPAVQTIIRNISERKKAEEELRKSYDLLNKLAAQVPGVVYQYRLYPDGHSAFPFSSPGMFDIYEVTPEEVREDASPVFSRLHPDDYDYIVETITESARNQTMYQSEFRVILPKQGLRWRQCNAKPELLEDGSTLWHGIILDITDRKETELALKESEDRYRRFISQVNEGVYRFEADQPMDLNLQFEEQVDFIYDHFFIAECNHAFLKMYGLTDEKEMIGKGHLDYHGGRNNEMNRNSLRAFIQNGYRVENAITEEINSLGQKILFSNNSIGIIEDNKMVRIWGTQSDITEKVRADQVQQLLYAISNAALSYIDLPELIKFIREQLGKLLDSTNFYIAFYDEASGMLSTAFDLDEKDLINTWPAEKSCTGYVIRQKKSLLADAAKIEELCQTGEIEIIGTPSKIWLGVPLILEGEAIGALVVQNYDDPDAYTEKDKLMLEFISDQISISIGRKKAEAELIAAKEKAEKSEQELILANKELEERNTFIQTVLDNLPIGVALNKINEGTATYMNKRFEEIYGWSFSEITSISAFFEHVYPNPNYRNKLMGQILDDIQSGDPGRMHWENIVATRKDGSQRVINAVNIPMVEQNTMVSTVTDITDLYKTQTDLIKAKEKAEESDRLKSAFLANMSHEIRTPLNSIMGFSDLLLDQQFDQDQHAEFAQLIHASGNNLLAIINDIMDISKIEAGQVRLEIRPISVYRLLVNIQREFTQKAETKKLALKLDLAEVANDQVIESDENRLRQVLINFVGNALKFTEKGYIELGAKSVGKFIQFHIRDTGIGIPKEYHDHIFDRFTQVESADSRKHGGNGLGLAISKSLIGILGGSVWVDSEPGKGSTFYFLIPVSNNRQSNTNEPDFKPEIFIL